jgi:hypothetical protein
MVNKPTPENQLQSLAARNPAPLATQPSKPSADDMERLAEHLTNLWDNGGLIHPKDKELTPEFLQILVWAVEDLTPDQHQQGIKHLVRHAKHFPNGAELRAACTGEPIGTEKTDPEMPAKIEANRLWAWLVKWARTLHDGHRYTMTTIPTSGNPPEIVSFTGRSLTGAVFGPPPQHQLNQLKAKLAGATAALATYRKLHDVGVVVDPRYVDDRKRRYFPPEVVEAEVKRYEAELEVATAAIEQAKALIRVGEKDRRYCRLKVEMAPPMPGYLEEVLILLAKAGSGPGEVIQRFLQRDQYLNRNFTQKALEVIAAHAAQHAIAAPALQLTGAVMPIDELVTYHGIIQVDPDGNVALYSVEDLQKTTGLAIDEHDMEAQAEFIAHIAEITNAPYPPPESAPPETAPIGRGSNPPTEEQSAGWHAQSVVENEYSWRYLEAQRLEEKETEAAWNAEQ